MSLAIEKFRALHQNLGPFIMIIDKALLMFSRMAISPRETGLQIDLKFICIHQVGYPTSAECIQ